MSDATQDTVDAGTRRATPSATDGTVLSSPEAGGEGGSEPSQGTIIGRYVVLSKLGAGAMGVVLAAYIGDGAASVDALATVERWLEAHRGAN
jgi:hypothetical protein